MNKVTVSSVVLALGLVSTALPLCAAPIDLSKLPPASTRQGVTYQEDIRPLFEASCVRCHSGQRPKARLRLDSLAGVLKGSKDGKVVVPGNSQKSKLVVAVARIDKDSAMPPKPKKHHPSKAPAHGEGAANGGTNQTHRPKGPPPKPLTTEQVSLVRAWVDQGAK